MEVLKEEKIDTRTVKITITGDTVDDVTSFDAQNKAVETAQKLGINDPGIDPTGGSARVNTKTKKWSKQYLLRGA